jgi:hypothetical protein
MISLSRLLLENVCLGELSFSVFYLFHKNIKCSLRSQSGLGVRAQDIDICLLG